MPFIYSIVDLSFNENIDNDICLVYNDENNKQLDLSKVEDE